MPELPDIVRDYLERCSKEPLKIRAEFLNRYPHVRHELERELDKADKVLRLTQDALANVGGESRLEDKQGFDETDAPTDDDVQRTFHALTESPGWRRAIYEPPKDNKRRPFWRRSSYALVSGALAASLIWAASMMWWGRSATELASRGSDSRLSLAMTLSGSREAALANTAVQTSTQTQSQRLAVVAPSQDATVLVLRINSRTDGTLADFAGWHEVNHTTPLILNVAAPARGVTTEWFLAVAVAVPQRSKRTEILDSALNTVTAFIKEYKVDILKANSPEDQRTIEGDLVSVLAESLNGVPTAAAMRHWEVVDD